MTSHSILYRLLVVSFAALLTACGGRGGGEGSIEGRVGVGEHGSGGEGGDEGGGDGSGEGPGEHGGGDGGSEGGNEGGGEGDDTGSSVPFVSSGQSLGVFESLILLPDESYAGLLNDTEIATTYDSNNNRFLGRLRNEAATAVCDVRVAVELERVSCRQSDAIRQRLRARRPASLRRSRVRVSRRCGNDVCRVGRDGRNVGVFKCARRHRSRR